MPRPSEVHADLADPFLFGNDAAEDEDESVFASYALDRQEVRRLVDQLHPLLVVRAYKGEGKSALLRLAFSRLRSSLGGGEEAIDRVLLSVKGSQISPSLSVGADFDMWVRGWKESICRVVAGELGRSVNAAWTDDIMTLVEQSETGAFRERSFVSGILSRLKVTVNSSSLEVQIPKSGDLAKRIDRYSKGRVRVWLFVDDIDENFQNEERAKTRLSAFFTAARQLSTDIAELRIRTAVRPNVWSIVKRHDESLSKIDQYVITLRWTENDFLSLLSRRVIGHFARRNYAHLAEIDTWDPRTLISIVFKDPMPWKRTERPAHVVISSLAMGRPRWAIELCRLGQSTAQRAATTRISESDIFAHLDGLGRKRLEDLIAEFRPQSPDFQDFVAAFANGKEEYSTPELIKLIKNQVWEHSTPRIVGIQGKPTPQQIGSLLFESGLITAREILSETSFRHVSYAENPTLLISRSNPEQGVRWEIPAVFRQTLGLRDASGKKISKWQPGNR